jgi:hypothetical protein
MCDTSFEYSHAAVYYLTDTLSGRTELCEAVVTTTYGTTIVSKAFTIQTLKSVAVQRWLQCCSRRKSEFDVDHA